MRSDFEAALAVGEEGESILSRYFERHRIPYFRAAHARKEGAAVIIVGSERVVVPDFKIWPGGVARWAECKFYKQRELWRGGGGGDGPLWAGCEFHGISRRLIDHYRRARDLTRHPVDLYIVEPPDGILFIEDFLISATFVKLGNGLLHGVPTAQIPLYQFRSVS